MKQTTIKVQGMVCGGCENRVKNALKTIEGVKEVEASYKEGTAIVTADTNVTEDSLKEKIKDIGFDVVE